MTRGAEGALLIHSDGIVEHPGVPVTVVDTVGAGDSLPRPDPRFTSGKEYAEILENACKVAAEVCSHAGAVPESEL